MGKGIIALLFEAFLFWCFYAHWDSLFEEQREQICTVSLRLVE